jgi:hypothetical protein
VSAFGAREKPIRRRERAFHSAAAHVTWWHRRNFRCCRDERELGGFGVAGHHDYTAAEPVAAGTDRASRSKWPFEIGLWVGRGATPNRMGAVGNNDERTARVQVMRYARDSSSFPPIPIDSCPWCGGKLKPDAFRLVPDSAHSVNLQLVCSNRRCDFSRAPGLPVQRPQWGRNALVVIIGRGRLQSANVQPWKIFAPKLER